MRMLTSAFVTVLLVASPIARALASDRVPISSTGRAAQLADHVYDLPIPPTGALITGKDAKSLPAPRGYEVVAAINSQESGFQGAAYKSAETGKVTVAYRGTEFGKGDGDLQADVQIPFKGVPVISGPISGTPAMSAEMAKQQVSSKPLSPHFDAQLKHAGELTDYAQSNYGPANVSLSGHSLGGAIAQMESARTGMPADAFNAPGMDGAIKREYPGKSVNQITSHNRTDDYVSKIGTHPGTTNVYPSFGDGMGQKITAGPAESMVILIDSGAGTAINTSTAGANHAMRPFSHELIAGLSPTEQIGTSSSERRRNEFSQLSTANESAAAARAAQQQSAAASTASGGSSFLADLLSGVQQGIALSQSLNRPDPSDSPPLTSYNAPPSYAPPANYAPPPPTYTPPAPNYTPVPQPSPINISRPEPRTTHSCKLDPKTGCHSGHVESAHKGGCKKC